MRLVLFDCDGTLADTFGLIIETMRRCFARIGVPEPEEAAMRGIIGLSLDLAIHRLAPTLDESGLLSAVAAYREEFHKVRAEGALREDLFPGAEDLLRGLARRDDVLLGMVTGKSRRGVRIVVEMHALEGVFQAVRTADDCPSKPHPAMVLECCAELGVDHTDTLVVGDAVYDMAMARAAGARALGVTWGAQGPTELLAAGAHDVVSTMPQLSARIDAWLADAPPVETISAA